MINQQVEKMGAKRPFQEDNFPELSFKQVKQFGFNKNLKSYVEDFPSHVTSPKSDFNGEAKSNFSKTNLMRSTEMLTSMATLIWFTRSSR
ncbi:uncharacterized protein LOC111373805 isoform X6 [Olea europaea var. sylvestris]|uniref:uncharacterized protein LOC111373805 isoform X6 n=1 Tax=Olea europaea var. sylvestris TaxID=158386 RepID=UPI000C1D8D45|nr:uncharacterized protein LOC111373805 isoform X6 [Olea europaea var. sylvestris]